MSTRVAGGRTFYRPEGIEVHVMVRVPMDASAYTGWTREQIHALLDGIGKVVAAKQATAGAPAPPAETDPQ